MGVEYHQSCGIRDLSIFESAIINPESSFDSNPVHLYYQHFSDGANL